MDQREYLRRVDATLDELGFTPRELRSGGHYLTVNSKTGARVTFPATPSDWRGVRNLTSELERAAGRRLDKQPGYRGGKRAPGYRRSMVHEKADSELEVRSLIVRKNAEIAALDTIVADLVFQSEEPYAHRAHILHLLTQRKLCERELAKLNQPIKPCQIEGLAALQAEWSAVPDDVPCSDEQVEWLRELWGSSSEGQGA